MLTGATLDVEIRRQRAQDARWRHQNDGWWLEHYRSRWQQWRTAAHRPSLPFPVTAARVVLTDWIEQGGARDPKVARLKQFVLDVCRRERITIHFDEVAAMRYGEAWTRDRMIETCPIGSLETAAIALHEVGHCLRPSATARQVRTRTGHNCCVQNEIAAWRWALDVAPCWERPMHSMLRAGLTSYRRYATPEEQRTIDTLMSFTTYAREKQRRLTH